MVRSNTHGLVAEIGASDRARPSNAGGDMSPSVAVPPRRGYSGGEGGEGSCSCGVDEILLIELSATAAVNSPTVLADTGGAGGSIKVKQTLNPTPTTDPSEDQLSAEASMPSGPFVPE